MSPTLRKNYWLIFAFLILISSLFIIALFLTYTLTEKFVDNEFEASKVDVLEKSIAPYNEFTQTKIPEVSFYQGFLDSASGSKYADEVLQKYPFVKRVIFFDNTISQHSVGPGFKFSKLHLSPKGVYQFGRFLPSDSVVIYKPDSHPHYSLIQEEDFNKMAIKFVAFLAAADTTQAISNEEIFNTFYSISPGKISYMNLPRREEVGQYKKLLKGMGDAEAQFDQDILTYFLDPTALAIYNSHPELYQRVEIKSMFYEPLDSESEISTQISLPGALSDYKIYFSSSPEFLQNEITNRFFPIAGGILVIYIILLVVGFLIYRNLNINLKMFKLQYDFVNNLSHEFKTPVSVIKIAGNNIQNAEKLTPQEQEFYGRILEEEADKLNNLLNTLLSFTQIENKVIKPKLEVLELDGFCKGIVDAYRIKYPDFDIDYHITTVEKFQTDITLLTSVFQNLIDNAYRYSSPDKKYMRISIYTQSRQIFFKFEDKGIGISKAERENVFKKFYRIQSEYNQQGSVGLGLAFCKEVVRLMKGDITVESKLGIGSTFLLRLPLEPTK